jgi:hypothetical protein
LGPDQLSRVVRHLEKPGATTNSACKYLYDSGLAPRIMHRSSISKLLGRARKQQQTDIVYTTQKPKKELSDQNKALRVEFALANRRRNWNKVLFTDRKRYCFKNPGVAVYPGQWVHKGQQIVAHCVNHADTYNLYCGMCRFGTTKTILVAVTTGHTHTPSKPNRAPLPKTSHRMRTLCCPAFSLMVTNSSLKTMSGVG